MSSTAADAPRARQAAIIKGGGVEALLDLVAGGPWKEAASQSLLLLAVLAGSSPGQGPDTPPCQNASHMRLPHASRQLFATMYGGLL